MSQSYDPEFWISLQECFSPSVVRLAVYKGDSVVPVNLGTGIILGVLPKGLGKRSRAAQTSIFVLTTMACHEDDAKESDYRVLAKVDDSEELSALVFRTVAIFTVLVITGIPDKYLNKITALDDASVHKGKIHNAEPVVAVGCFSNLLKEIAPSGYVSISDINMDEGSGPSHAFTHSCPIGDGLIGAPVINRHCKIIGINFRRTTLTSKVNYAMKSEELNSVLAQMLGEEDPKKPMSSLLEMLRVQILDWIGASVVKKTGGASTKKTGGGSSSSATWK